MKRDHEDDLDNEFLMLTKRKKKDTGLELDEEDVTEADFEDGYDSDLMGDDADEQYLNSLSELDREMILLERYEKREDLKRLREEAIRSGKLKVEKYVEKKNTKRNSALSDIRAKRQAKRQEPVKKAPKSSYENESSYSINNMNRRNKEQEEEVKVTFEDLQKITLSRRRLEKWVNEPFFEKTVLHCFVRASIGEHNGIRVYRFCEISGFKEKSLYQIDRISTSKHLILKQGGKEKSFPISLISNSSFTNSEFNSWLKAAKESNDFIPTEDDIEMKLEEFEKASEYTYTEDDINKRLEEKKKLGKEIPGQNLAVEKLKLCTLRDECFDHQKMDEYNEYCKKIEQIEILLKKREESLKRVSTVDISKITKILNPNSFSTTTTSLNSNISSKVLDALKDNDEDEFGIKKKKEKYDAFSRRPTRSAGMYVQVDQNDTNNNLGSPSPRGSGLLSPIESPSTLLQKAHDFDLVLDFDSQTQKIGKKLNFVSSKNQSGESKKSISIEEYKRRKGI
eukprot:gene2937-4776_t